VAGTSPAVVLALTAVKDVVSRPVSAHRSGNGLAGTLAVPVMTGGWAGHALAVEVRLRPVLAELGATVPARGLYVTEPELTDVDAAVAGWAATAVPLIRGVLAGYEASEA